MSAVAPYRSLLVLVAILGLMAIFAAPPALAQEVDDGDPAFVPRANFR